MYRWKLFEETCYKLHIILDSRHLEF